MRVYIIGNVGITLCRKALATGRDTLAGRRWVLTDVTTDMVITKEETFDPVAPHLSCRPDIQSMCGSVGPVARKPKRDAQGCA
jgi:hypothetical protein